MLKITNIDGEIKEWHFPCVKIELDMVAHNKQNAFLSNKLNKSQFISLFGNRRQTKGFIVHQSSNDAETLIAKCAIELAYAGNVFRVIEDDTDILVFLMYYFQPQMADIFLFSIASERSKSGQKIVSLENVTDVTDPFIKENIYFAHAWSSCDTTSSTYGYGKSTILKYLKENKEVREISQLIFSDSSASHLEILEAGIQLFLLLYGAKETTLNMHRYITYARLNYSSKNQVKREKLPPTESAAEFHSLRVHCQILKWKNEDQTDFSPTQWGCKNCNGSFEPIDTILELGLAELLNVIRCNCKLSAKNPCGASNCSCRKKGLPCVTACRNCHGDICTNVSKVEIMDKSEDECFERNAFELFDI